MNEGKTCTAVITSLPQKLVAQKGSVIVENSYDGAMMLRGLSVNRVVLHKLRKHDLHDKLLETTNHIKHWEFI